MNIIQQQADDFVNKLIKSNNDYSYFISLNTEMLSSYKKNIHKIAFLERVLLMFKARYDRHLIYCSETQYQNCRFSKHFQLILFYLQNEIEFYERKLPFIHFKKIEKKQIDRKIDDMISLLSDLKYADKNKFDLFTSELQEMRRYYFLDKKNWKQLFSGKIMEMQTNKIISDIDGKKLITKIDQAYHIELQAD